MHSGRSCSCTSSLLDSQFQRVQHESRKPGEDWPRAATDTNNPSDWGTRVERVTPFSLAITMHNTTNTHPIHEKAPRRGRKTLLAAVAPGTGLPSGTPHMALGMEIGKIGTVGTVGTIGTRPTRSISPFAAVLAIPHYTVCITPLWGDTQRFPGLTECGPPAAPSLTMRDFLWGVAERERERERRRGA